MFSSDKPENGKYECWICLFLRFVYFYFRVYEGFACRCEGLLVDLVVTAAESEVSSPGGGVSVMSSHDGTGN